MGKTEPPRTNRGKPPAVTPRAVRTFREKVYRHYRAHGRDLPWRRTGDPYAILVSEIMLQQTQVERVAGKYGEFMARFPDPGTLARAPLRDVLAAWQGMGYNRRAIALREGAERILKVHGGEIPRTVAELMDLPGVGRATACAVAAFAFGLAAPFIETNIRRVFIHFFFPGRQDVKDAELMPLVERTMDRKSPRHWYYALMDYGVMLRREVENPNRRSAHYRRQPSFEGSTRQMRGRILKALISGGGMTEAGLAAGLGIDPSALRERLAALITEGFIRRRGRTYVVR